MLEPDADGVYARLSASPARRGFAVMVLGAVGALVLVLAFNRPPGAGALAMMVALALGCLWLAGRLWQATALSVELTEAGLCDSAGTVIAAWTDIAGVDRGALSFKPSNGFVLRLHKPLPRDWAPGLWWRVGRRVGIGGVTPAGQAKVMAEAIGLRLAARDGADRS